MMSVNNKIICSPYEGGKAIKSEVKNAFAVVKRKQLVGLKVLEDAGIVIGNEVETIPKGAIIYISEEYLAIHVTYSNVMENEKIGVPFVIAEYSHVVMVDEV